MTELATMTEDEARKAGLYVIPDHYLADAQAAFAKLAKRAAKRLEGCASPALVYVATGMHEHIWYVGDKRHSRLIPAHFARIDGAAPKLAGWSLAARLIVTETGERILKAVPGVELPARFRDTGTECEHCQTARFRKDVFVCHNEERGEWKQIGRTCVRDFLGHDPARLLAAFVAVSVIGKEFGDFLSGGHAYATFDTVSLLEYTAACIRVDGWTSRAKADAAQKTATSSTVIDCFARGEVGARARERYAVTARDTETARDALQWVRGALAAQETHSDYEFNLVASLRHAVIDARTVGIAASSVQAYLRAMSREAELNSKRAANALSVFVGTEKERLKDIAVTIEFKTLIESDFGASYLLKMRRADGCLFSWFCSGRGADEFKPGDAALVTGTVKAHREYKGTKETQLTRCKLAPVNAAKAA